MTRCHICDRPCVYEVEPAFDCLPAEVVDDVWQVAMRNGLFVDACHVCWMRWPDGHKLFPPVGFGRWPEDDEPAGDAALIDASTDSPVSPLRGGS
jgi:hypothetical protein